MFFLTMEWNHFWRSIFKNTADCTFCCINSWFGGPKYPKEVPGSAKSRIYALKSTQRELKFIYSEKATKICKISTLLLTVCITVKSKVETLQNFVAFSEYMNFIKKSPLENWKIVFVLGSYILWIPWTPGSVD